MSVQATPSKFLRGVTEPGFASTCPRSSASFLLQFGEPLDTCAYILDRVLDIDNLEFFTNLDYASLYGSSNDGPATTYSKDLFK